MKTLESRLHSLQVNEVEELSCGVTSNGDQRQTEVSGVSCEERGPGSPPPTRFRVATERRSAWRGRGTDWESSHSPLSKTVLQCTPPAPGRRHAAECRAVPTAPVRVTAVRFTANDSKASGK